MKSEAIVEERGKPPYANPEATVVIMLEMKVNSEPLGYMSLKHGDGSVIIVASDVDQKDISHVKSREEELFGKGSSLASFTTVKRPRAVLALIVVRVLKLSRIQ